MTIIHDQGLNSRGTDGADDIDMVQRQLFLALQETPQPSLRELAKIAMRTLYERGWRPIKDINHSCTGP
jgi:hypothetical protein